MLKIVPDPPLSPELSNALEDLLMQISERLFSAIAVAHQNALQQVTSSGRGLSLATMHELEAASTLVETALGKIQVRH
ncbi:hypothetical protein KSS94_22430 [Pseudomonas fakonensis]|uniref:DUF3077 domain-containing protein n=1 Tax=Pseudomonas fakonensis TaxID=2842355 RepID=A0ABX8N2U6_9PSED|nr:hypothetical protein [Pseudomonas fakonensis]QXH50671.1 hypothetical protein KSS94_22430 [Pseudomonas fakonensis]